MTLNRKKIFAIFLFIIIIVTLFLISIGIRNYSRFRQKKYYRNQSALSYSNMEAILSTIHYDELQYSSLYQLYKDGAIDNRWLLSPFFPDDDRVDLYFSVANKSTRLSKQKFYLVCGYKIIKNGGNSKFTIIDQYNDKLIIKCYVNSKGDFIMKKVEARRVKPAF